MTLRNEEIWERTTMTQYKRKHHKETVQCHFRAGENGTDTQIA